MTRRESAGRRFAGWIPASASPARVLIRLRAAFRRAHAAGDVLPEPAPPQAIR